MIRAIKDLLDNLLGDNLQDTGITTEHEVQLACAALLIEVMKADEDCKPEEEAAILDAVKSKWQLSEKEVSALVQKAQIQNADSTSLYEFTYKINDHFNEAQKFELIKAMWAVAYSDGELDKYEESLIRKVSDLIHLHHVQFIKAKQEVLQAISN